ncbi:MAG: hypothetical protein ACLP3B_04960 [Syntrophobacteraceae bacterium]
MQNVVKVNLRFRWYKLLLFLVTAGLLTFGFWAFFDSVSIGSSHAAFRFLLLFVIWSLPGIAILAFVRPKTDKGPRN